ncbi:luciferase family oxidoreductase group 1 [Deinobacterium chartae]|uniref:Luciferase family oxidoreductase group 1 n=1 Tax=Deinobacterium chartae TaxID=521158 RepID=A0A841HWI3_9DEIO|nr:LLM class flavin-dependent oxidoreductase [Deinobacterium chartae]MBB6097891.1 luciferase family oxidoreductase group 1 [Deinobacterium chartae]
MIPFSILDLATIFEGSDAGQALRNTLETAQLAEQLGYHRYWLAEHHNMPTVASAATAVVIGQVAAVTRTLRVGSGGVMLPNHAPLVIAEQFGTLEALFPGRIDLGLGRAPGTDMRTARALRRDLLGSVDRFPQDVLELQAYFDDPAPGQAVQAVPGAGLKVPLWLLGSSTYSAQLAARLGLPFAFASHFAPAQALQALQLYRSLFQPSAQLQRPYAMVAVNAVVADSDAQAQHLSTSLQQTFLNLARGQVRPVPAPVDDLGPLSESEKAALQAVTEFSAIGSPQTVRRQLEGIIRLTAADEIMSTVHIFDREARLYSLELLSRVREAMAADSASIR